MKPNFFYPSKSLQKYISRYWYWLNITSIPSLPPGSGCELFIFNQKVAIYDACKPDKIHYVNSVLIRPRNAPIHFFCQVPTSFISIRFRLGAINYFSSYLESELHTIVDTADIWGIHFHQLYELILNTSAISRKIEEIEFFLHNNYKNNKNLDLTNLFLNQSYYNKDNISITEITKNIGYSQRYLQKTVKGITGLSLIEIKRLIRFEHTLKYISNNNIIKTNAQDNLLFYYDQSHFIKEFSYFTGMTPKFFLREHNDISFFFNQINSET